LQKIDGLEKNSINLYLKWYDSFAHFFSDITLAVHAVKKRITEGEVAV